MTLPVRTIAVQCGDVSIVSKGSCVGIALTLASACASEGAPASEDASAVDSGPPDVVDARPFDAPPTCGDGVQNGNETDVDCGGACEKCNTGRTCKTGADCREGTCFAGTCAPTTWFAESNGTNVTIPPSQTWTAVPNLSIPITLYADAFLAVRFAGTLRFAGGGNGLCHVGERFVVDGKPLGNPTWGSAIMVERGATRWHETMHDALGITLSKGSHQIAVELTNANGFGACFVDGDGGQPYDRSRLAIAAYDPKDAFYIESTGSTGAMAPGAWTAIPGVSLSPTLAAAAHVQFELSGTEYAAGSGSAHCAYRLNVDGKPLGDPNHGQTIAVGDTAGGWWAPVALAYGMDLAAGAHTIVAEARNSGGPNASCNAGEGGNDYSRFRLLATTRAPGGPNVSMESSGAPNVLGSGSAWTPVSGLGTSFILPTDRTVQFDFIGAQYTVSGSGHCAWRFVVDGTALGQPDHGQALNVGDSTTWWESMSLLGYAPLKAGPHGVAVEVRNSSSSGDCGANADANAYSRARLLVRAP